MKNPSEKELDALAPLPLIHSIHDGLRSYEGTRLGQPCPCPTCGTSDYHKHDTRRRVFAVLIGEWTAGRGSSRNFSYRDSDVSVCKKVFLDWY